MFVNTPKPPYYAVIFSSQKTEEDLGYAVAAKRMSELAAEQHGYLGVEDTIRDENGFGMTVSYWESEAAIKNWRDNAEHILTRERGNKEWYKHYELRVAKVERAYGMKK